MEALSGIVALKPVQLWGLVVLFLPGFISLKLHKFIERREPTGAEAIIDVVGFSLLNAIVLWWPIYVAATHLAQPKPSYWAVAECAVWVCLVGPAAWPIAFQLIKRFALRGRFILGEQKTAFDAVFSTGQPCWVVVHMADGGRVGGFFGASSYASAHPHSGDFYLEELWNIDADGRFITAVPDSKGALFRKNDYVWLELFWDRGTPVED